jgi:hypothetical protein
MSDIKQSKKTLLRQAKEKENAARIAAKNRATLEKKKLTSDPAYLTAKAKQQRNDDINRIMTIFTTYKKNRVRITKADLKFIVSSSEKYKYPLMIELLRAFNDIVNRLNISHINNYADTRIKLFLKNVTDPADPNKPDPQIVLLPASNPLYKVGLVNLLVRIKKNIIVFTDDQVKKATIDAPVNGMDCLKELCSSFIWNLKINDCDGFTLLNKDDQQDKYSRALFRICKIVNNPIPNLQEAEEKLQNDANAQINNEAVRAQADAANGIKQPSFTGGGDTFENTKGGINLDPNFLLISGIFRNYTTTKTMAITDNNIKVIIDYAEKQKQPLNVNALKILNDDLNKLKISVWIGYITPKLIKFFEYNKLLPPKENPLYPIEILNNAIKIKKGIQTYKKKEVVKGSDSTILDYPSLQELCIGYINDIKINNCAMYNLKGKDQQKDMYTNELYRICTMVGVPIKSIDLADRNMNIIDVLKKNVKKAVVTPVVKEEGFTNILPDNNIIDSLKNYLLIVIFILIFFYICRLYIE